MKHLFKPAKLLTPLLFLTLTVIGCGGPGTFPTELVTGTVTVDGAPVEGATVTFHPITEGQGNSAVGMTDASGVYHLTVVGHTGDLAPGPEKGTTAGEYEIKISKFIEEDGSAQTQEEVDAQGLDFVEPDAYAEVPTTYIVPQKYMNFSSSELKATVATGENNIPFELTSK
ncbi:MAG: carboxypeptidase-like regulatory domain-containing protein [Pirellulales bacterium]